MSIIKNFTAVLFNVVVVSTFTTHHPPQCSSIVMMENITEDAGGGRVVRYLFNLTSSVKLENTEMIVEFRQSINQFYSISAIFKKISNQPNAYKTSGTPLNDSIEMIGSQNLRKVLLNGKSYCENLKPQVKPNSIIHREVPNCNNSSIITMEPQVKRGRYYLSIKLKDVPRSYSSPYFWIAFDEKVDIFGTNNYRSQSIDFKFYRIEILRYIQKGESFTLKMFIDHNGTSSNPKVVEAFIEGFYVCGSFKATTPSINPTKRTQPVTLTHEWLKGSTPTPDLKQCTPRQKTGYFPKPSGVTRVERGQFPWHVAIYFRELIPRPTYIFKCAGSLVTRKTIVTAAHCVTRKIGGKLAIQPIGNFLIYLGLRSLRREMGGEQKRKVSKIIYHPEYEPSGTFSNDIAVMKFIELVKITDTVAPICLVDKPMDKIISRKGLVAGWGLNPAGELSDSLGYLEISIVPRRSCLHKNVFTSLSDRQFCAGRKMRNWICSGDSGSGLMLDVDGKFWRLVGVVSITIGQVGKAACDPRFFTVFTDVNKLLPWIKENIG